MGPRLPRPYSQECAHLEGVLQSEVVADTVVLAAGTSGLVADTVVLVADTVVLVAGTVGLVADTAGLVLDIVVHLPGSPGVQLAGTSVANSS